MALPLVYKVISQGNNSLPQARRVVAVQVSREVADAELSERVEKVREAETDAAARAELEELKRVKKRSLVRVDMPTSPKPATSPNAQPPAS